MTENSSRENQNKGSDEKAESEWKAEYQYYESLQKQSLENMPPVLYYKVVRAILKNMLEQDGAETIFMPATDSAESILEARSKAMAFAEDLFTELQEAKEKGLVHFDPVPETVEEIISSEDRTILSVHVNVMYREPFTEVDLLNEDISQSNEDVIYHTDETETDFDILIDALNREAHSLRINHAVAVVKVTLPDYEELHLVHSDYERFVRKAFITG